MNVLKSVIMSIVFRELRRDDYQKGIMELYNQLTKAGNVTKEMFEKTFDSRQKFGSYRTIVGEIDGEIACAATLLLERKYFDGCKNLGHIEDVVVDSKYRNLGLGRKVLEQLKIEASKSDCYKMVLDCQMKNVGFYKNCGFILGGNEMSLYLAKE